MLVKSANSDIYTVGFIGKETNAELDKLFAQGNVVCPVYNDRLEEMKRDSSVKVASYIQAQVIAELRKEYPECIQDVDVSLPSVLAKVNVMTKEQFIIIIDEWDCLFREDKNNEELQKEYVGFTETEVKSICRECDMPFNEMQRWYDGYFFEKVGHVYSPNSVIKAVDSKEFGNYWSGTETYESLMMYIVMDFDGLRQMIVDMLGGLRCHVDV